MHNEILYLPNHLLFIILLNSFRERSTGFKVIQIVKIYTFLNNIRLFVNFPYLLRIFCPDISTNFRDKILYCREIFEKIIFHDPSHSFTVNLRKMIYILRLIP